MRFENSELLRLKKSSKKILERLCEEKKSITPNTKELPQKCKYYKEIETVKDKLQSCIDSLSKNLEITRCQANQKNIVLKEELEYMMAERDRAVAALDNSVEDQNKNQVSTEILKAENYHQKQEIACLTEELKPIKISVEDLQVETKSMYSEKNIAVSKLQKMQGKINAIILDLSTMIKKEEYEE